MKKGIEPVDSMKVTVSIIGRIPKGGSMQWPPETDRWKLVNLQYVSTTDFSKKITTEAALYNEIVLLSE